MEAAERLPKETKLTEGLKRTRSSQSPSCESRFSRVDENCDVKKIRRSSREAGLSSRLELILSIQNKDLSLEKKIEHAYEFVLSNLNSISRDHQPVSLPRLASFLGGWVQSILISSDKSSKISSLLDSCLDFRCWFILHFCVNTISSFSISQNLLRAITRLSRHVSSSNDAFQASGELCHRVFECLSAIFFKEPNVYYNAGVDLWLSCGVEIVGLIHKVVLSEEQETYKGCDQLLLSDLILKQLCIFLRFHPNPKNVFKLFIDRLLEPLMELYVLLELKANKSCGEVRSFSRVVEEVLVNGLFHAAHISGFLIVKSTNSKQETSEIESYHMHFFRRIENIIAEKKVAALECFGFLFEIFSKRVKAWKGSFVLRKGNMAAPVKGSEISGKPEPTNMPLFEVFEQFMKPLLVECKTFAMDEFKQNVVLDISLIEAHCMLKSMNEILNTLIQEKIYARLEDTNGKNYSFLVEVFDSIVSISCKICSLWLYSIEVKGETLKKLLCLLAREVLVALGHYLEIEYRIVGVDLVKFWLVLLAFSALHSSIGDVKPFSLLKSEILDLGCHVIKVYGELRQVDISIVSLCKAMRFLTLPENVAVADYPTKASFLFLSSKAWSSSIATLLCCRKFRITISEVIKSIPEGQASFCINKLSEDVTQSLEWMLCPADGSDADESVMSTINNKSEILGRFLSEVYTVILDSTNVISSNCVTVGNSVKTLMENIRPNFIYLVQDRPDRVDAFLSSISGGKLHDDADSSFWILSFFFSMYLSCRSLYRQVISLLPPKLSRKASEAMGSVIHVSSGVEWTEILNNRDEGFFSWITKPSISLFNLSQHLSEFFYSRNHGSVHSLVYIFHAMALQRLVDLNMQINALVFLYEREAKLHNQCSQSNPYGRKSRRKWKQFMKLSRTEAEQLTTFLAKHLETLPLGFNGISKNSEGNCKDDESDYACGDSWDLGICSISEKTLPIAYWWLLCETADIWCSHAIKADLKKFCYLLMHYSLFCRSSQINNDFSQPKSVTIGEISLKFFSDTIMREEAVLTKFFSSSFRRIMKDRLLSILPLLDNLDWRSEAKRIIERKPKVITDSEHPPHNPSLFGSYTVISDTHYLQHCQRESSNSCNMVLETCESLLDLLTTIAEAPIDSKSCLVYSTCVLDLEKLFISCASSYNGSCVVFNTCKFFKALGSCRRVLKCLVMATIEDLEARKSSSYCTFFPDMDSTKWLVMSIFETIRLWQLCLEQKYFNQVEYIMFQTMDYSADILFSLTKRQVISIEATLGNDINLDTELSSESVQADKLSVATAVPYSIRDVEYTAEVLLELIEITLLDLKGKMHVIMVDSELGLVNWDTLSSVVSCSRGFIWGLASSVEGIINDSSEGCSQLSRFKRLFTSKVTTFVNLFTDLVNLCLMLLLFRNQKRNEDSTLKCFTELFGSGCGNYLSEAELNSVTEGPPTTPDENPTNPNQASNLRHRKDNSSSFVLNAVNEFDLLRVLRHLNLPLLQSLLRGSTPSIAFAIKQLFMASAAILKLNYVATVCRCFESKFGCKHLEIQSMHILLATSLVVLLEMAETGEQITPFSFSWLDGVVKFLEVLGFVFNFHGALFPMLSFSELTDVHIRAVGRCISLVGKSAILFSDEASSSTKLIQSLKRFNDSDMLLHDQFKYSVNAFRAKLHMSFQMFIRKSSKLYLLTIIKALERALIGVHRDCNMVYNIKTGDLDGGEVSSCVAAGIDCLDSFLLIVPGKKKIVQKSISGLLGAVYNIIIHLQNPSIFYIKEPAFNRSASSPDPGAVVLMSVCLINKIAGGHSYKLDAFHASHLLHIPTAVFQNFLSLNSSDVTNCDLTSENKAVGSVPSMGHRKVDGEFTIDLYVACCRLLSTMVRNRKREVGQCAALFGDSMMTLLSCLEMAGSNSSNRKIHLSWGVEEAVKCAGFFRRIYEEIRQQRDVFVRYVVDFLSVYVSVCSGYGKLKFGLAREIDEAMRPGVYSLIDICTPDDLQRLHTVLNEGPCRSTLANLQRDYRLSFQYEGKT